MYSKEFRTKVVEEYLTGNVTFKELSEKYSVAYDTVKCWHHRYLNDSNFSVVKDSKVKKYKKLIDESRFKDMHEDELRIENIKLQIENERLKKLFGDEEPHYGTKGVRYFLQEEYKIIFALSEGKKIPVSTLLQLMDINKSGYYSWLKRISSNEKTAQSIRRDEAIEKVRKIHEKHPSHGYKWVNAVITHENDGIALYSDEFIRRIFLFLNIKSMSKHVRYKYRKERDQTKFYPNLILNKLAPSEPYKVIVSDMTAIRHREKYYKLTMYMDLFNNQILTYAISGKRGDPNTYYNGLTDLIMLKDYLGDSEMQTH